MNLSWMESIFSFRDTSSDKVIVRDKADIRVLCTLCYVSNAKTVSIWWRRHVEFRCLYAGIVADVYGLLRV